MKFKKNNKGIILIESILALTVIIIVLTALVTALVSSISGSNFSKDQSEATALAQEGIEIARDEKESDFQNFFERGSVEGNTYCLGELSTSFEYLNNADCEIKKIYGKFKRHIYINTSGNEKCESENPSNQAVYVSSTVEWTDSKCSDGDDCHKVEVTSCFVNLDGIQ